ncbi:hypothetical protein PENSPDRAFT_707452 [Peniophora sp. CONT]|nr:hypothetical protein PENSPDRAFT_707452 [Peniophora sp. CONT]
MQFISMLTAGARPLLVPSQTRRLQTVGGVYKLCHTREECSRLIPFRSIDGQCCDCFSDYVMAQQAPKDGGHAPGFSSSGADTSFINPADRFWSLYIDDAEKYDKVRLERWNGDTGDILIFQWTRVYLQQVQRRGSPSARGPIYAALATEIEDFRMEDAISWIVSLLHIAVLLFFIGLLILLFSVNRSIGIIMAIFMTAGALAYIVLSVLPVVTYRSPYRTPLSPAIRVMTLLAWPLYESLIHYLWEHDIDGSIFAHVSGLRFLATKFSNDNLYSHLNAVRYSKAREQIVARSVEANVSNWTELEWSRYHCKALKHLHESVDQLNEIAIFCDALTSMLDSLYSDSDRSLIQRSFELRAFLILDLDIYTLLRKLFEGATHTQNLSATSGSHWISSAMSLVRALMRDCNSFNEDIIHGGNNFSGAHLIVSSLLDSQCLSPSFYSFIQSPPQHVDETFWYSLASIRADLFAVYLDNPHLNAEADSTFFRSSEPYIFRLLRLVFVVRESDTWLHDTEDLWRGRSDSRRDRQSDHRHGL